MTPHGAAGMIDLRQRGQKPVSPLLVSLVGKLPKGDFPLVVAEPGKHYDWRFLRGLEAHIWVKPGLNIRRTLLEIDAAGVGISKIWDVEKKAGAWWFVAWPQEFWDSMMALLETDFQHFERIWSRRYEHPGLSIRLQQFTQQESQCYWRDARELYEAMN